MVPSKHSHRYRYFGVLAPNSPHRTAVTEIAQSIVVQVLSPPRLHAGPASSGAGDGPLAAGSPLPTQTEPQPVSPERSAHYLWEVLNARIYEVFPLLCPLCGGQMRIIAFITLTADLSPILGHIGVYAEPQRITPARGQALWNGCDAQVGDGVEGSYFDIEPN